LKSTKIKSLFAKKKHNHKVWSSALNALTQMIYW